MKDENKITISRVFPITKEKLWQVWTQPASIKKWWGPEGFTAPNIEQDLRVGGEYLFTMHGPKDTEFDIDLFSAGVYKEIIPLEKIVATDYFADEFGNKIDPTTVGMDENMPSEMEVAVTFEALPENRSRLTIQYPAPETEAEYKAMEKSGMVDGWNSSLDKLEKAVKDE